MLTIWGSILTGVPKFYDTGVCEFFVHGEPERIARVTRLRRCDERTRVIDSSRNYVINNVARAQKGQEIAGGSI